MNVVQKLRKSLAVAGIAGLVMAGSFSNAAAIPADILWVIDVSASMGGDISQIRTRIGQFDTALTNAGIDANYGLIEFGGNVSGTDDWSIVNHYNSFCFIFRIQNNIPLY